MAAKRSVLGTLPVERFLKKYWQKEPLLIRGAFPGFHDPLSPDELAGLACEPSVDSRLVVERGGQKPWQVTPGPQRPSALRRLPRSHWTLLVESMDRHSTAIAALASAFSFLPTWRMDDVMVSLSPMGGTVDAHIDSYDVFLVQGQGRRRWEVDRRAIPDYRPGLDLRILKRFKPEDAWILEPGDMLYVPPGVGHRGVTVAKDPEISLTYSVGFRAPSLADLLSSATSTAMACETPVLFSDVGRRRSADSGELSGTDLVALKRFLVASLRSSKDSDSWAVTAGQAVTAGGRGRSPSGTITARSVARRLNEGASVSVIPGARVVWSRLQRGRAALFVNGESRELSREQAFAAPFLCGKSVRDGGPRVAANSDVLDLAVELLRAGVIALSDSPRSRR